MRQDDARNRPRLHPAGSIGRSDRLFDVSLRRNPNGSKDSLDPTTFAYAISSRVLAERHGGVRPLARAMAGQNEIDFEPTMRRWFALARREPRPIGDLNRLLARLAKFSRTETRKMRRRIVTEPGPAGDRQAIVGHMSLARGAENPVMLTVEETLALPAVLTLVALLALVCQAISRMLETMSRSAI